tara:strand:- start:115 stop:231 length:117 start_codon:yes stop_codon:yes gene_type:complete
LEESYLLKDIENFYNKIYHVNDKKTVKGKILEHLENLL